MWKPGQIITLRLFLVKSTWRVRKIETICPNNKKLQMLLKVIADRFRQDYKIVKKNLPKDCTLDLIKCIKFPLPEENMCSMRGTELY